MKKITNDRQILFDCDRGYKLEPGSPQGATCVDGIWSPSGRKIRKKSNFQGKLKKQNICLKDLRKFEKLSVLRNLVNHSG